MKTLKRTIYMTFPQVSTIPCMRIPLFEQPFLQRQPVANNAVSCVVERCCIDTATVELPTSLLA